mmetsp:Transcript_80163/g.156763  ORF Transcript_80163/g.156763 Transcript_80163/m.156763 type:complete len:273 (-) Transcript_80163:12-830(-)
MVYANNGPGGFSPNLHQSSGKVCLSLLGTWDGPGWKSGESNLYQVLASILWMILGTEHPYYMEPGHGGWEGTAPKEGHSDKVIEYDEEVKFGTAKWAILETLRSASSNDPPKDFGEVVRAHFASKRSLVLSTLTAWHKQGSEAFKARLGPVLGELEANHGLWWGCEEAQSGQCVQMQETGLTFQHFLRHAILSDVRRELEAAKEVRWKRGVGGAAAAVCRLPSVIKTLEFVVSNNSQFIHLPVCASACLFINLPLSVCMCVYCRFLKGSFIP